MSLENTLLNSSIKMKKININNQIFLGFLFICVITVIISTLYSYHTFKSTLAQRYQEETQKTEKGLTESLNYAISRTSTNQNNLKIILKYKINEISDIHNTPVIIYDLEGNLLLFSENKKTKIPKTIPSRIIEKIKKEKRKIDILSYDEKTKSTAISSYILLSNNNLEPVAIVYYPSYYNDNIYQKAIHGYLKGFILIILVIILVGILLSWFISRQITISLRKISETFKQADLLEEQFPKIKYYRNDELSGLINSYNKMIQKINQQKKELSLIEKEEAWKEMAKQVAHEVKNPLTPMKLLIQNFERKFDIHNPNLETKVKHLSQSLINQIDIISSITSAFSEFAKLPQRQEQKININKEIENITEMFNKKNISISSNQPNIIFSIDKTYFTRIINNLVTNAQQAKKDDEELFIDIKIYKSNYKLVISIEDNGCGIAKDELEKIFEINFTSKNTGSGLGLTMVKKMVEEYNGTIFVESEINKGSKFTISFPILNA